MKRKKQERNKGAYMKLAKVVYFCYICTMTKREIETQNNKSESKKKKKT